MNRRTWENYNWGNEYKLWPGGEEIKPEVIVREKVYSRPIVIYGANGQELVRKEKPEKIPFGFIG